MGNSNPFRSGFVYSAHGVSNLMFSPTGNSIAFSCGENKLYICDIAEQGQLHIYEHSSNISALAWSPDGQYIASISSDEQTTRFHIWEVVTGKQIHNYEQPENASIIKWSLDGRYIATGGWDKPVQIWDPATGETLLVYSGHTGSVSTLAWSPDSTHIVSGGGDGSLHVWEVASGTLISIYYGHSAWVNTVAWSPDGHYVASGSDDQSIQIWHAKTRERLFTHRQWQGRIMEVKWSPDGKHIISGTWDGTVQECEATTDQHTFFHHSYLLQKEPAIATAWQPDLSLIAFGGTDRCVEVADLVNGKLFLCRGSTMPVELIAQANGLVSR